MVSAYTPVINLEKPTRGDYSASGGDWDVVMGSPATSAGSPANLDRIDNAIGGILQITLPTSGALTLTADQAANQVIQPLPPSGGLLGDVHVYFPAGSAGLRFIYTGSLINAFNGHWLFFRSNYDAAHGFYGAQFRYPCLHPVAIEIYPGWRCMWADYGAAPPGVIKDFIGTVVPPGWLLCDGHLEFTTIFDILYGRIGQIFGGSGVYFAMPDLRGITLVGADDMSAIANSNSGQGSAGRFFNYGVNTPWIAGTVLGAGPKEVAQGVDVGVNIVQPSQTVYKIIRA